MTKSSTSLLANDAYTTLSQNLIVKRSVRVLLSDWFILENYERATLNINMPYCEIPGDIIVPSLYIIANCWPPAATA